MFANGITDRFILPCENAHCQAPVRIAQEIYLKARLYISQSVKIIYFEL